MAFLTAPYSNVAPKFDPLAHAPIVIGECGSSSRRNGFDDYRFSNADIFNLPQAVGRKASALGELLPVIEQLCRQSASAYENVADLYARLGVKSVPSKQAIRVLRNLFLNTVDRRLQKLYRGYLQIHPPPPHARHDQKVASLEATHAQAQDIVSSFDWHWLSDWLELARIGENAEACVRRLSNFAFPLRQVNFRFTYHCNIKCRHCYNTSGPHLKAQRIALEPMLAIIAQMPDAGIGHLNLTGGEPFLYPDHLTALIAAGRTAGLRGISIFTNGYWAPTDDRATRVLERLAAAGFMQGPGDFIKVSTGAYHQEFVAFDRVLTLARSYYTMFGRPLRVDCELAPGAIGAAALIRQQVHEAGLADRLKIAFRNVSPLGRGKELLGIAIHKIDAACNAIQHIVFDPDGSARPCCGMNNENQGVVIGKLKTHRLADLIKRMQNDPILQFVATNPMSEIFGHLATPKNPDGYADLCHLCQDALGDLRDKEPLQAKLFDGQTFYPFWFTLSRQDGPVTFQTEEPSDNID